MKKILVIMLAIAMILAMVPAVALAEGETVNISTAAELKAAIENQQPGQTWSIASGTYDIGRNSTITTPDGKSNWYFPIVKDGITINGAGPDTVITSSVVSRNGNLDSQDTIAIWGNNVTISNLTIRPKLDTNKAIEVMGKNVTLQNITILHNNIVSHTAYCFDLGIAEDSATDYWEGYTSYFAGSIFFFPQNAGKDIGVATLDNVFVTQAWISCSTTYVNAGTLNLNDTTIDFRNCWYAGYEPDRYGVFSKNPGVTFNVDDFTVIYDDLAHEQKQVLNLVPLGTTLIKADNTEVTAAVDSTYTIIIPATVNFGTLVKNSGLVTREFDVTASGVIIEDDASIDVKVTGPFLMSNEDGGGDVDLPFALSNEAGAIEVPYPATFATFTAAIPVDGTENGSVSVDTDDITAAGSYKGTMVFSIVYNG